MYLTLLGFDVTKMAIEGLILLGIVYFYSGESLFDSMVAGLEGVASNVASEAIFLPALNSSFHDLTMMGADVVGGLIYGSIRSGIHDFQITFGNFFRHFLAYMIASVSGFYVTKSIASLTPASQLAFENRYQKGSISSGMLPAEQEKLPPGSISGKLF